MNGNTFLRWLQQLKARRFQWRPRHGASGVAPVSRGRGARNSRFKPQLEALEERVVPAAPLTPAQIRAAYGIDQIKFGSGIVGNGSGQTIVVVELGIDDYLTSDLQYFDRKLFGSGPDGAGLLDTFGSYTGPVPGATKPWFDIVPDQIAPPLTDQQSMDLDHLTPQQISQHDVAADLDVEWSHAIAPMANILVVQTSDIQAGTDFAGMLQAGMVPMQQQQLGISVITSNYYDFPQWHPADYQDQNVAYVNITGGTGTSIDSQQVGFTTKNYPAASPLVIAVGGTTLTLNADGSYGSETGWGFASPNRFLTSDTASYSPTDNWQAVSGGFSGTSYLGDLDSNGTATWTTTVTASDTLGRNDNGLEISATWTGNPENAHNAEYEVDVNGSPVDYFSIDQSVAPVGTTGTLGSSTATFQELCTLTHLAVGDTITVVLYTADNYAGGGAVIADAIGLGPDDASGGGFSNEDQPGYQAGLQNYDGNSTTSDGSIARATPDVAFDGDYVNSPVEFYDQGSVVLLGPGTSPIRHGAGTTLGAPCWAGLIAIADQGLATAGQAPMGTAEALAGLYSLPSYDFHDETSGYNGYAAGPGYDMVTGLGSPIANQLIPDLDNEVLYLDNPVLDMTNSEPQVSGPLVYEAPEGQGPNNIDIFRFGPTVGIEDNGQIVATKLLADTTAFDIIGASNTTNTLNIDFDPKVTGAGIIPDLAYPAGIPVTFDGGSLGGGSGTLILTDGTFTTEIDSASGPHSGTITLDSTAIAYTNLAPIIDTTTAVNIIIQDPMPGDHITVQDDPNSPEGGIPTSEIDGSGFEKVDFANKTNVEFVDTSGAGTDTFNLVDPLVDNGSFIIGQHPAITNGPATTKALLDTSYAFQYTATGAPAPSFSLLPGSTLPTGLTLSLAGLLSGTDTNADDVGQTFTGTVDAANGVGNDATQAYSITVELAPSITNGPPTTTATLGTPYTFTYTTFGFPAPSFKLLAGSKLPPGLTLSAAGNLSGTPSTAGTFTGTVDAGNGVGTDATQAYSITVAKATPTIGASAAATVVLGTGVNLTASARLGGGYGETGTITFTLYAPNNTVVHTETVAVSGNGTYKTPNGFLPKVRGTYQWVASYSGDANNKSAGTAKGSTPEIVVGPGPTVVGEALYLVGGIAADRLAIAPIGASQTGSTGIKISGELNNISFTNLMYTQAFSTIYVVGFGGNDTIQFAATLTIATFVSEGDGNDRLQLGNGKNQAALGNGNDVVTAGKGNDVIHAGGGTDTVTAGAAGSTGAIQIRLGNGNHDSVSVAGNGSDQVQVGNGNNDSVLVSGNGNDQILVGNGDNDSVSLVGNGNEVVQTGTGTGKLHIAGNGTRTLRLGKGWTQV
jgi:hypothetical protein